MTESTPTRFLKQPRQSISFEVETDDLNCILCKKLRVEVYQAYCKCIYCKECFDTNLSGGGKRCFGGKAKCQEEDLILGENILGNAVLTNEIMKVKVICPNKSCSFTGNWKEMQEHVIACIKQTMQCPFVNIGCSELITCNDTRCTHINNDTLAHSLLLSNWIECSQKESAKKDTEISNVKENLKDVESLMAEQKKLIDSINEESGNKDKQIRNLKSEMNFMKEGSKNLKDTVDKLEKEFSNHMKETKLKNSATTDETNLKEELTKEISLLKKEIESWKEESISIKNTVDSLNTQMTTLKSLLESTDESKTMADIIGGIIFTIDKFRAKKDAGEDINSPYFYSHRNGYKLKLSVEPSTNSDGNGTYLTVYIVICQGENDDLLLWPCKHSFKISIVNQHKGYAPPSVTFNYSTSADSTKGSFQKPIYKDNPACGYNLISNNDLQSTAGLIVNDSVVIKCVVTAPA